MSPERGGIGDRVEAARSRLLAAVMDGETALAPLELSTLLLVGGEEGIEETAGVWLSRLREPLHAASFRATVPSLYATDAETFSLDDEVVGAATALLDVDPELPIQLREWRGFELGRRAQVLLLLASLIKASVESVDSEETDRSTPS